jgi:predicted DNA-binding protein with PD1-like motif
MESYHLVLAKWQDLGDEIQKFFLENNYKKWVIVSCIWVLSSLYLSFDWETGKKYQDGYSIAQVSGFVENNNIHLHISLFDRQWKVLAWHLLKNAIIDDETHVVIGML